MAGSGEDPLQTAGLALSPHTAEGGLTERSPGLLHKGANAVHRGSTLMAKSPPRAKARPPSNITLETRFQVCLVERHIQSIALHGDPKLRLGLELGFEVGGKLTWK